MQTFNLTKNFSFASVFLSLIFIALIGCKNTTKNDVYVVMLSLDAFRWDYPTIASTPNINQIAKDGVHAEALIPCYPSKTFPNHYSMATGLHPDKHGIVCNRFLDSTLGFYSIRDRKAVENPAFYGGEPIWLTAEKQGLIAATYFWVGSEAPIGGQYPTYWKLYENKSTFESRIDTIIHWLSLPIEKRPRLIAWYSPEPDASSHSFGSTDARTLKVVENLDSLLGVFLHKVQQLPHANKINILVVSDHGMADVSAETHINLTNYIDRNWFEVITGGNPVYTLQPKKEFREQAISALKAIPNLKVWERHEIPNHYHYGTNQRIQDILIEAEVGYGVGFSSDREWYSKAVHGYDSHHPDMSGIFYAFGPNFKKNYKHKAFQNTNLYLIVAHILGLEPAKTDGVWDDVKDMFN